MKAAGGAGGFLFQDTFTDSDGALTGHISDSGHIWGSPIRPLGNTILSNQLLPINSGAGSYQISNFVHPANVKVNYLNKVGAASSTMGIVLRGSTSAYSGIFYRIWYAGQKIQIFRITSGAFLLLGEKSLTIAPNTEYAVEVVISGNTHTMELNGDPLTKLTVLNSDFSSETGFGFRNDTLAPNLYIDDLTAEAP